MTGMLQLQRLATPTPTLHHEGTKVCNKKGTVVDLGESNPCSLRGLASFPGLSTFQFLTAYNNQEWRGRLVSDVIIFRGRAPQTKERS